MGAPAVLWDENAAYNQLRAFLVAACPDVLPENVYRARPSAVPGDFARPSIVIDPLTPAPEYMSAFGSESDSAQQQQWKVTITTAAVGAWTVTLLGETTAPFVAGGGDDAADIAVGLRAAVDALALAVTTAAVAAPPPGVFTITGGTAGVSLGVSVAAPVGGASALVVVDDNIRRATWNWGVWRVRLLFRDVPSAARVPTPAPRYVSATLCERVRMWLQASSLPVTNGSAYPYRRDNLQAGPARLSWLASGIPIQLDVQENGAWVRTVALDVDFQTPVAMTYDVPSLDSVGLAVDPIVIEDE
jgi:hypothetical protein